MINALVLPQCVETVETSPQTLGLDDISGMIKISSKENEDNFTYSFPLIADIFAHHGDNSRNASRTRVIG